MLSVDAKAFVPAPPGLSLFDAETEGFYTNVAEAGANKPDFLLMCDEHCSTACPSPELMATETVFYGSPLTASPCFSPWASPMHGFSTEAPQDFPVLTQFSLDGCLLDFELSGIIEEFELSGLPSSEEAWKSGSEQEGEEEEEATSSGFKLEGVDIFQDMLKALLAGSTTEKTRPLAPVQSEAVVVEFAGEDIGAETIDDPGSTEANTEVPDYSPSVNEFPALISAGKLGNVSEKPQRSYLKAAKKAAPESALKKQR